MGAALFGWGSRGLHQAVLVGQRCEGDMQQDRRAGSTMTHWERPCIIGDPVEAQDTVGWRRERREGKTKRAHVWVLSQRPSECQTPSKMFLNASSSEYK